MNKNITSITENELSVIDNFMFIPIIIVKKNKILFASKSFIQSYIDSKNINALKLSDLFYYKRIKSKIKCNIEALNDFNVYEIRLKSETDNKIYVNIYAKVVKLYNEDCMLLQFTDITENVIAKNKLVSLTRARNLMLKVTENIINFDDINDIYTLILDTAIKVYNHNYIGTIMTKNGAYYEVVAYTGYDKDIEKFRIKEEDTFLYKVTNGKMDKTVIINNTSEIDSFIPVKTIYGDKKLIKATLAAPIILKGEIFGMIFIDSIHYNVFSKNDLSIMKFLKSSSEIAISNYLLYKSKLFYANHDGLTKLYNRVYFENQFCVLKEKAVQEYKNIIVAMIDVNDLKHINDTFGHDVGDEVLKKIARNIESIVETNEMVARIGGDEFIISFFDKTNEEIFEKLNRILKYINKEPLIVNDKKIECSFCYGTSLCISNDNHYSLKELVKQADINMYKSKKARKQKN